MNKRKRYKLVITLVFLLLLILAVNRGLVELRKLHQIDSERIERFRNAQQRLSIGMPREEMIVALSEYYDVWDACEHHAIWIDSKINWPDSYEDIFRFGSQEDIMNVIVVTSNLADNLTELPRRFEVTSFYTSDYGILSDPTHLGCNSLVTTIKTR